MKVTIIDLGKQNQNNSEFLDAIKSYYKKKNKEIDIVIHNSTETEIKSCIGCWSCWWKSPGECALQDTAYELYRDYINSDEVVILFHTKNGFIDGKGKTFLDRLIQHYLPYIQLRNGECTHLKRYHKYPILNFYFEKEGLSVEEISILKNYLARTAYHFQSPCKELIYEDKRVDTVYLKYEKAKKETRSEEVLERETSGKWVIYNGSPRGNNSNSMVLIEKIITGMKAKGIEEIEVRNLITIKEHKNWAEKFCSVQNYLFVFPLYVHAMPGSVMKFFEQLVPVNDKTVHMAFLVQSGFPEASQSYYLRPYLEIFTKRLGVSFDGIMIKGGVEGIRMRPDKANKKLFYQMETVGKTYASKGIMDLTLKQEYEKSAYLSKGAQFLFTVLSWTGLTNFYWDYNLKKNGAYQNRFAKPYLK